MSTITIVALGLVFLGGIGAILLAIGQANSASKDKTEIIDITKKENAKLKTDIAELKSERNELSAELSNRDSILQRKNDIIIELNQKLSAKSEYIKNYLTGGIGYPVLYLTRIKADKNDGLTGMFNLKSSSKFPIYNLIVRVFDYDLMHNSFKKVQFSDNPVISISDYDKAKILVYKLDELSPTQILFFNEKIELKEARYFIQLQARNNTFIEKIAIIFYKSSFYLGFQVYTIDGELLKQDLGDDISAEVKAIMIQKLNSIPLTHDKIDVVEK